MIEYDGILALERMERAVLRVAERLDRSTSALQGVGIPYALGGSNATTIWIASVEESAVRQARNVELVLFRADMTQATTALQKAGFSASLVDNRARFLDGPDGKLRDAVEITFGNEAVVGKSPTHIAPAPHDSVVRENCRVLHLDKLVEFQLARFRLDDAVDLRDLIDVGLVDASWPAKYQPELAARLQHLLDTKDG